MRRSRHLKPSTHHKPGSSALQVTVWLVIACPIFPSVPANGGELDAGRHKAKVCTVCHGIDGISTKPDAPNIAGQTEYYLQTQLAAFRSGKRFHQQMNVVAQSLSDADIDDLAAWYSSIKFTVELPPD